MKFVVIFLHIALLSFITASLVTASANTPSVFIDGPWGSFPLNYNDTVTFTFAASKAEIETKLTMNTVVVQTTTPYLSTFRTNEHPSPSFQQSLCEWRLSSVDNVPIQIFSIADPTKPRNVPAVGDIGAFLDQAALPPNLNFGVYHFPSISPDEIGSQDKLTLVCYIGLNPRDVSQPSEGIENFVQFNAMYFDTDNNLVSQDQNLVPTARYDSSSMKPLYRTGYPQVNSANNFIPTQDGDDYSVSFEFSFPKMVFSGDAIIFTITDINGLKSPRLDCTPPAGYGQTSPYEIPSYSPTSDAVKFAMYLYISSQTDITSTETFLCTFTGTKSLFQYKTFTMYPNTDQYIFTIYLDLQDTRGLNSGILASNFPTPWTFQTAPLYLAPGDLLQLNIIDVDYPSTRNLDDGTVCEVFARLSPSTDPYVNEMDAPRLRLGLIYYNHLIPQFTLTLPQFLPLSVPNYFYMDCKVIHPPGPDQGRYWKVNAPSRQINLYTATQNVFFRPSCMLSGVTDTDTTVCTQVDSVCDRDAGFCTCQNFEPYFSPSVSCPDLSDSCDELVCLSDLPAQRSPILKNCVCNCDGFDNFFRDCRSQSPESKLYHDKYPIITLEANGADASTLPLVIERNPDGIILGTAISTDFGSLTEFYNGNLDQVEFFEVGFTQSVDGILNDASSGSPAKSFAMWSIFGTPDKWFADDDVLRQTFRMSRADVGSWQSYESALTLPYHGDQYSIRVTNPLYQVKREDVAIEADDTSRVVLEFNMGMVPQPDDSVFENIDIKVGFIGPNIDYQVTVPLLLSQYALPTKEILVTLTQDPTVDFIADNMNNLSTALLHFQLDFSSNPFADSFLGSFDLLSFKSFTMVSTACFYTTVDDPHTIIPNAFYDNNTIQFSAFKYPTNIGGTLHCTVVYDYNGSQSLTFTEREQLFYSVSGSQALIYHPSPYGVTYTPAPTPIPLNLGPDLSSTAYNTPVYRGAQLFLAVDPSLTLDRNISLDVVMFDLAQKITIFQFGLAEWWSPSVVLVTVTADNIPYVGTMTSLTFTVQGLPAILVGNRNSVLYPYCAKMSIESFSSFSSSTLGICLNSPFDLRVGTVNCNYQTNLCECPTAPEVAGDICDGNPPGAPVCQISCQDNNFLPDKLCARCEEIDAAPGVCRLQCANSSLPNFNDDTCTTCLCPTDQKWTGTLCNSCNLKCLNGGVLPSGTCSRCTCPQDSFFTGDSCETCTLQCSNGGVPASKCSTCNCTRRGYSGPHCACRQLDFKLTMLAVPHLILDQFEAGNPDIVSSPAAIEYIRGQLLSQPQNSANKILFDSLSITLIELLDSPYPEVSSSKALRVSGYVTDNCSENKNETNYLELEAKWRSFLNSLRQTGIIIDGKTVPITDIDLVLPSIQCDDLFDPDCDGVINSSSQFGISLIVVIIVVLFAF